MTINERIKILVDELANGNIRTFSKAIGVTPGTITNIFHRGGAPSFKVIAGICEVYPRVNANWLIGGSGEKWQELPKGEKKKTDTTPEAQEQQAAYERREMVDMIKMDLRLCEQEREFLKIQIRDKDTIIDLLSRKPP